MAETALADDMLNGMAEICRYLNIKPRRGYELAEKGQLPLFKIGDRKWQGRKSTLRRHIERLEAAATYSSQSGVSSLAADRRPMSETAVRNFE